MLRPRIGWPQSKRQPEAEQELHDHADHHVEKRVDQRAGHAAGAEGRSGEERESHDHARGDEPADRAHDRGAAAHQIATEEREEPKRDNRERDPMHGAERPVRAEEMIILRADEELSKIRQADEFEGEAARCEREAGERQIGRDDERKDREAEKDDDRRQHHDPAGMPVDPFRQSHARGGVEDGVGS